MLPSEKIELQIFRYLEKGGKGQWQSIVIASLGATVGNNDLKELVDTLLRLQARGHIQLRKWIDNRFLEYRNSGLDDSGFFYQYDFQVRVAPEGQPYFEQLMSRESTEDDATDNQTRTEAKEVAVESDEVPNAFISYSWETDTHKSWVRRLAQRLRSQGVKVILDWWHLKVGGDRTQFMESSISKCQFVIIICTPTYAQKANRRHGGVGYEAMIITSQLAQNILQEKFIPVLRSGEFGDSAVPQWLQSKIGVDLRGDPYDEQEYDLLLKTLHKAQPAAPPVGPKPVFPTSASPESVTETGVSTRPEQHSAKPIAAPSRQLRIKRTTNEGRRASTSPKFATRKRKPANVQSGIPDNFLLGTRNAWAALLEESWPEIGWPLLAARDGRTIEVDEICRIFDPVKKMPHNPGLAAPLYRPSFEIANSSEVLATRRRFGEVNVGITRSQVEYEECQRSCAEAEAALKIPNSAERDKIEQEAGRRNQRLIEVQQNLERLNNERDSLDLKMRDQEAYVYRFELRDFLLSGSLGVNPRTLANALAGLPTMSWRQSLDRCSAMTFDPPRLEYCVWELISEVWQQRPTEFAVAPVDFFKDGVLKLDQKFGFNRQFLHENWRDLRKAIEECWRSATARPASWIPFGITSIFMRNLTQQKDASERILGAQERLVPLQAGAASVRS